MIHWPDWTIAGALCGFDRDPMQGGARVVAQVQLNWRGDGTQWTIGGIWHYIDDDTDIARAQRAAEAAIGGQS